MQMSVQCQRIECRKSIKCALLLGRVLGRDLLATSSGWHIPWTDLGRDSIDWNVLSRTLLPVQCWMHLSLQLRLPKN